MTWERAQNGAGVAKLAPRRADPSVHSLSLPQDHLADWLFHGPQEDEAKTGGGQQSGSALPHQPLAGITVPSTAYGTDCLLAFSLASPATSDPLEHAQQLGRAAVFAS